MIAYIIVNITMESIDIISLLEIIKGIRHGSIKYFNNIYNIYLSKI